MSQKCSEVGCAFVENSSFDKRCITYVQHLKMFCKKNNLCVRCTYENPTKPTVLSDDGLLCPVCDYDEYEKVPSNT